MAEVRAELTSSTGVVTVPQLHAPGEEAEVDFGELKAWVDGVLVKLWMFCLRLSASGRAFHVVFSNQAQEAFLEGHRLAFEHLGGVPGRVRYDNLKPAVVKVLMGRDRVGSLGELNELVAAAGSGGGRDRRRSVRHGSPAPAGTAGRGVRWPSVTDRSC